MLPAANSARTHGPGCLLLGPDGELLTGRVLVPPRRATISGGTRSRSEPLPNTLALALELTRRRLHADNASKARSTPPL